MRPSNAGDCITSRTVDNRRASDVSFGSFQRSMEYIGLSILDGKVGSSGRWTVLK